MHINRSSVSTSLTPSLFHLLNRSVSSVQCVVLVSSLCVTEVSQPRVFCCGVLLQESSSECLFFNKLRRTEGQRPGCKREFRTESLTLRRRGSVQDLWVFIIRLEGLKSAFLSGISLIGWVKKTDIQSSGGKVSPRTGYVSSFLTWCLSGLF